MESRENREQLRCCIWKRSPSPGFPRGRCQSPPTTGVKAGPRKTGPEPETSRSQNTSPPGTSFVSISCEVATLKPFSQKKSNESQSPCAPDTPRPALSLAKQRNSRMRQTVRILVALAALFAATTSQAVILKDIGTGSDFSNLYIQFSDPLLEAVHYRYFYNYDTDTPLTGAQMIFNIANASGSNLTIQDNGGTADFQGFLFIYEFAYNGDGQYGDFFSTDTWNFYVSGGENVVYDPDTFDPVWGPGGVGDYTFATLPSNAWLSAPVGPSDRVVAPGSWDGWTFGEWPGPDPTIAPIPEPSTWALIAVAVFIPLVRQIRRRSA